VVVVQETPTQILMAKTVLLVVVVAIHLLGGVALVVVLTLLVVPVKLAQLQAKAEMVQMNLRNRG
jgi:hypothetical protein